jgi:hypothetical protein
VLGQARPSLRYVCRRTMGDVAFQSRSSCVRTCGVQRLGSAAAQRSRCHRHLDRPLAAYPAQGLDCPLRLRSASALRDLGRKALRRKPRQGARVVPPALSDLARSHRLGTAPAHPPRRAGRFATRPFRPPGWRASLSRPQEKGTWVGVPSALLSIRLDAEGRGRIARTTCRQPKLFRVQVKELWKT